MLPSFHQTTLGEGEPKHKQIHIYIHHANLNIYNLYIHHANLNINNLYIHHAINYIFIYIFTMLA